MLIKPMLGAALLALALIPLTARAETPACPPTPEAPSAAALEAAGARASDRGLLWRLSKNGRSLGYLYGSIHVGKLDWIVPGPKLAQALHESETWALELDPADPAIQRAMAEGLAKRALAPDAALRQRLAKQASLQCLPEGALAALHPLMQAFTLTVLAARWDGLETGFAQEQVLSATAQALKKPVISLENAELQLAALLPDSPAEALAQSRDLLDQLEQGKVRPVLRRLGDAWERGDLAALENYEQWCDCVQSEAERAQLRRLNDARNPYLAERIDGLIAGGHKLFAAVGALHMTGPQALPRLLEQKGYRLERLH